MSIREPQPRDEKGRFVARQTNTNSLAVVPTYDEYETDDAHERLAFQVRVEDVREGWNGPWAVLIDHGRGVNPDDAWIHIDRGSMADVEP